MPLPSRPRSGLNEAFSGGLTSFATVLLATYFLQQHKGKKDGVGALFLAFLELFGARRRQQTWGLGCQSTFHRNPSLSL